MGLGEPRRLASLPSAPVPCSIYPFSLTIHDRFDSTLRLFLIQSDHSSFLTWEPSFMVRVSKICLGTQIRGLFQKMKGKWPHIVGFYIICASFPSQCVHQDWSYLTLKACTIVHILLSTPKSGVQLTSCFYFLFQRIQQQLLHRTHQVSLPLYLISFQQVFPSASCQSFHRR